MIRNAAMQLSHAHPAEITEQATVLARAAGGYVLDEAGLALPGRDPFRTQLLLLAIEVARARHEPKVEAKARREARAELGLD